MVDRQNRSTNLKSRRRNGGGTGSSEARSQIGRQRL